MSSAAKPHLRRLAERDARAPLQVQVSYRGGAEAWWELRARGRVWRFPGHHSIHDVLMWVNEGRGGKPT